MYSTAHKNSTFRVAIASGFLQATTETLAALKEGRIPKGNAIELARAAGVLGAKKCYELLPYCHPVPIDQIEVDFTFHEASVEVVCTAVAVARTGLEMEALTGASIALLTLYDMLKPLDKNMKITEITLLEKQGGKSDFKQKAPKGFRLWVVTSSDGTYEGKREDKTGPLIREFFTRLGAEVEKSVILPDDQALIEATLREAVEARVDLVLTTGGSGLGPKDLAVEATEAVIEREIPGVAEAMRVYGQSRTPFAMLSRAMAGQAGKTMIVNLPGSSRGTEECLHAIFPALFHVFPIRDGAKHKMGSFEVENP